MDESEMPKTLVELVNALPNYVRNLSDFSLDKQIGKGGFGEVWHAVDKRTQMEVAVKELFVTKMTKRLLKAFIREVYTNAKCASRFVVKFVGFTVESPYCIIQGFENGGCLVNYIFRGMPKYNKLSGTQLTKVAMGVAHALSTCQKLNVIHRDVKPANVLLDDKKLPFLCDFGIARIVDNDNLMTRRSGTIVYMAPEVYNKGDYDTMVDVYSYAMMLFEMSEGVHVYDMCTKEMMMKILMDGKERPNFTKKTNIGLRKLIEACWEKDPNNRPTFHEIYKRFASGTVGFTGYDKKKMVKFAKQVKEQDSAPHKEPRRYVHISRVVEMLQSMEQEIEADEEEDEDIVNNVEIGEYCNFEEPGFFRDGAKPFAKRIGRKVGEVNENKDNDDSEGELQIVDLNTSILKDIKSPLWFSHLHAVAKSIQRKDFETFFSLTGPFIVNQKNEHITKHVQYAYCEAMMHNPDFVTLCYSKTLYMHLPLSTPALVDRSLDLLAMLFMHQPHLIDSKIVSVLNFFFNNKPEAMIYMYSFLVRELAEKIENVMVVLDLVISKAIKYFELECGDLYISLLVSLLQNNEMFREARFEIIRPIFIYFTNSSHTNVASAAYSAIATLWDDRFPIDFELIHLHSQIKELGPALASLLIKIYNKIPATPKTIDAALNIAASCEEGSILPMLMAQVNAEAAVFIARNQSWYQKGLPDAIETYRLTLVLFGIPVARGELFQQEMFPYLCSFLAAQQDDYIVGSLYVFFTKFTVTAQFVGRLTEAGFFKNFAESVERLSDTNAIVSCALLVDMLAKAGPSVDYPLLVTSFMNIGKVIPDALPALAITLATLSYHKNVAIQMKSAGLATFFIGFVQKYPQYKMAITPALQNINL